jgi:hypothetical protein
MKFGKTVAVAVLIALSLGLAGCSEWQGSNEINPVPPGDRRDGPGLFTGKEGGIVFYVDPWFGASPYGGAE